MVVAAGGRGIDCALCDAGAAVAGALAVVERRLEGHATGAGLHIRTVRTDVEVLAGQRRVDVEAGGAVGEGAGRGGQLRAAVLIAGLAGRAEFLAHGVGHGQRAGRGVLAGVLAVDVEVAVAARGPDGAVRRRLGADGAGGLAIVERSLEGDVAGLGAGALARQVVVFAGLRGIDADAGSAGFVSVGHGIALRAAAGTGIAAHTGGAGAKAGHQRAGQRAGRGAREILDAAGTVVVVILPAIDGVDHAVGDGTADRTGGLAAGNGLLERHGIGAAHALAVLVVVVPGAIVRAVNGDAGDALRAVAARVLSGTASGTAAAPTVGTLLEARRQRLRDRAGRGSGHAGTGGVGVVIGAAAGGIDGVVGGRAAIRTGRTADGQHGAEGHALGVAHAAAGGIGVVILASLGGIDVHLAAGRGTAARGGTTRRTGRIKVDGHAAQALGAGRFAHNQRQRHIGTLRVLHALTVGVHVEPLTALRTVDDVAGHAAAGRTGDLAVFQRGEQADMRGILHAVATRVGVEVGAVEAGVDHDAALVGGESTRVITHSRAVEQQVVEVGARRGAAGAYGAGDLARRLGALLRGLVGIAHRYARAAIAGGVRVVIRAAVGHVIGLLIVAGGAGLEAAALSDLQADILRRIAAQLRTVAVAVVVEAGVARPDELSGRVARTAARDGRGSGFVDNAVDTGRGAGAGKRAARGRNG